LERFGLLRRERRVDPQKRRQKSTRYILAFEEDFDVETPPETGTVTPVRQSKNGTGSSAEIARSEDVEKREPCLKMRHGAVSQKQPKPCLKKRKSRVSICDTNLVREPVRNQRTKNAALFFTADERFEAKEISERIEAGGRVVWSAVPRRVGECLVAEGLISDGDAKLLGLDC